MPTPQFFDIFGFFIFVIFTSVSILALRGRTFPKWLWIVLLLLSLAGLIVDAGIVYVYFL